MTSHSSCDIWPSLNLEMQEHDPEYNFISVPDAFNALCDHVTVQPVGGKPQPITVLDLEFVRNNSFATRNPLVACAFEYQGSFHEDVLLKVYTCPGQCPGQDHTQYMLEGYIHAMQVPREPVRVRSGCFVGLVIHKDLNKDWLWKMKEEDPKKYNNFITRSDPDGYQGRGDTLARRVAKEADYLVSFTTGNKVENDKLLENLSDALSKGPHGERSITFCTDRSLGFGGHFSAPEGLYLAKNGFGQPVAPGAWFDEYRKASCMTRHGVLILNFTKEYLASKACRMEFGHLDRTKIHIYVANENLIVPWNALKSNPVLCEKALGRYSPETFDPIQLAQEAARFVDDDNNGKQQEAWCALPLYEIVLALVEAAVGNDNLEFARAMANVGNIYRKVGLNEQAKDMLERVLRINERHHGEAHASVASTLTNLASAHHNLGDAKTAKQLLERALRITERHYGEDHVEVAITLTSLAIAHGDLGDAKTKKQMLERALRINVQHYTEEHVSVAITLTSLANAYSALGDAHTAKQMLERALRMKERHYGEDHASVAITLTNLAKAHGDLGDAQTAKQMLERALRVKERHYGEDHASVASTLTNLANAHGDLGDAQTAKQMLERALRIDERHYGEDHASVANTLTNLAIAHFDLADPLAAKQLLERALRIHERHYGEDHVEVAITLTSLASALGALGDAKTTKQMLERALRINVRHYGVDHASVSSTLTYLANAYSALGDAKTKKQMLERALRVKEGHQGEDHASVAITLTQSS